MSTGLFSAVELDAGAADARIGWRLERLEVLNWGTFDRRVWTFEANGHNADENLRLNDMRAATKVVALTLADLLKA